MEEFRKLLRIQNKCVDRMYYCIDTKNIEGFVWYFELWHDVTSSIYNSKFNECGHRLSSEILDFDIEIV